MMYYMINICMSVESRVVKCGSFFPNTCTKIKPKELHSRFLLTAPSCYVFFYSTVNFLDELDSLKLV